MNVLSRRLGRKSHQSQVAFSGIAHTLESFKPRCDDVEGLFDLSENVIVSQLIFTVGVMITRRSCSMCVEYSSVSISSSHFQFGWMGEDWWWNNLEISQVNADETSVREIAGFHRRRLYFVDFSSQSIVNYTRRLLLLSRKWSLRSKRVYFSILRLFSFHFHIGALFFRDFNVFPQEATAAFS